jgi:peptidoglycan/LPS O-acetylase OafA/YrhL
MGVDVFFVLSGFLITGILFDALDAPRYFRDFYIRRTLRIFPLFFAFWLLMVLLTPFIGIDWNRYNLTMVAYVGNFFRASALAHLNPDPGRLLCLHLLPKGGVAELDATPLWSLCVEEQFYLLWPAVVWFVRSRTKLLAICIAVIVAEPFLREAYWHVWPATAQHGATYFNTFTRLDTLLVGAAIALWLRGPSVSVRTTQTLAYTLLVLPLPLFAFLVHRYSSLTNPLSDRITDHVVNTIGLTLVALFAAGLLLLAMQPDTWLYKLLRLRPLTEIGRRSYGLYLVHSVPLFVLVTYVRPRLQAHHLGILFLPIAVAYTFGTAWLSFRYLESPFLRLKDRFAPNRSHISDPQPV